MENLDTNHNSLEIGSYNDLRNELIKETISSAATKSSFYRELYREIEIDQIMMVSDLYRLPITNKKMIREAGKDVLCKDLSIAYVQNTSGSTGEPLLIYRSFEESEFIKQFFREISKDHKSSIRPLVLALETPHHGTRTSVPGQAFVLHSAAYDDILISHCIQMLQTEFKIPGVEQRVSSLNGPTSQVQMLTSFILNQEFANDAFNVSHVFATSRYLTQRWRRLIKSAWNAKVVDRYSLSEIFGGATYCSKCNGYHFDPNVVPEVIGFDGNVIADEGVGMLVLTSLSPFVQLQPFIRYETGDVFKKQINKCSRPTYIFWGRKSHALFDPYDHTQILISGVALIEALDNSPLIRRSLNYQDISNVPSTATGLPIADCCFKCVGEVISLKIAIGFSMTPSLFPEECSRLRESIVSSLMTSSEKLQDGIQSEKIKLEIVLSGPDELQMQHHSVFDKRTQIWKECY